jgi:hypothetical protein
VTFAIPHVTPMRISILLPLALILPIAAHGQTDSTALVTRTVFASVPKTGTMVRVTVQDSTRRYVVGRLWRLTADSIELIDPANGSPIAVPRGAVERVETRAKRENALNVNGVLGGTLGLAGSGYALWRLCRNGADCWTLPQRDEDDDEDDGQPMPIGVAGLVSGAVIGGLLGYAVTPYGWKVSVLPYMLGSKGEMPVRGVQVAVSFNIR